MGQCDALTLLKEYLSALRTHQDPSVLHYVSVRVWAAINRQQILGLDRRFSSTRTRRRSDLSVLFTPWWCDNSHVDENRCLSMHLFIQHIADTPAARLAVGGSNSWALLAEALRPSAACKCQEAKLQVADTRGLAAVHVKRRAHRDGGVHAVSMHVLFFLIYFHHLIPRGQLLYRY